MIRSNGDYEYCILDDYCNHNAYFYNLETEQINAKYYRYDKDAMENPQFYFQPSTDTLNFATYPCYSMTLTQENLTETEANSTEDQDTENNFEVSINETMKDI